MSPFPNSFSAPVVSNIVLESILELTLKLIRLGKFDFISPVTTSTEGLCVATTKWIPVALPS